MADDPLLASLETIVAAIQQTQEVADGALTLLREHREHVEELAEDIAALGLRVAALERHERNEHSLGVATRREFRTIDELAAVLRHELADEVQAITARIDAVHKPALRALTQQQERNHPA